MEKELKPARIPIDFSARFLNMRMLGIMSILLIALFAILLLGLPDHSLLIITWVWILAVVAVTVIPLCYDVVAFPEGIQIRMFGKVLQQIPVSDFKLLCGVENDRSYSLCLSVWNLEELALRREEILQKGHFSRQDLPFRKQRAGWQERFAKEYLLKPKWSIRKLHTGTPLLWLRFDPVVITYLRRLYPQLPYLDLRSDLTAQMSMQPPDQIPFYTERYRADAEGLHIFKNWNKQELRCFPASQIKTIFRMDRFTAGSKVEPPYGIYLVVSELSLAELAEKGKRKGWQKWKRLIIDQLPEAEQMYAVEFHFSGLFVWNRKTASDVHIMYTPENEALLRRLYPHAQWVDYSKEWK